MAKKPKEISRQAKWAKGKAHIILLTPEHVELLDRAVENEVGATEQYKSTKSRVVRWLIDNCL